MMKEILFFMIFTGLMWSLDCQDKPRTFFKSRDKLASKQISIVGPVTLEVVVNEYHKKLRINCVAKVTYAVDFEWKFNNNTLFENERVKIVTSDQRSQLVIRRPNTADGGAYECVARYNRTSWAPNITVPMTIPLKYQLKIRVKPKDAVVRTGESFQWFCSSNLGNLTNVTYSWARKLLPGGEWKKFDVNNAYYKWQTPHHLHTKKDDFDVYDLYCEVTYRETTVRSPLATLVVIQADAVNKLKNCSAEEFEGIYWNETLLGMATTQFCLPGDEDSGIAVRVCEAFPGRPPSWRAPNFRDCRSPQFTTLQDEFDALQEGFKVNFQQKLDELRVLTQGHRQVKPKTGRSARLFGKDLLSTIDILKRTPEIFKKEQQSKSAAKETLSSFTETASNVLDLENERTWLDIDEGNPETPAYLVTSLEDFGFDLEKSLVESGDVTQNRFEKNLAFQMRRFDVKSKLRNSGYIFEQNSSRILLPQSIFNETANESITVVSVVFDTLSSILGEVNTTGDLSIHSKLLANSRIISSAVQPLSQATFQQPVKIVLENNGMDHNENVQRRCVFWRPGETDNEWSDEGCRLVPEETTINVTTCECDHLTLFAVMVESAEGDLNFKELSKLEVISTVGSAISLAAVLLTMFVYIYFWKTLWSARFVNLMNLCLALALLDIFSVLRGPVKNDEVPCTVIGILLHYFLLALFMWMLCEGILLCLLLTDVFKQHYGRKWYAFVHLIGWGVPAVIVIISLGARGFSYYGFSGQCWLSRSHGFIWAAMAPMIVVLLASYAVYGVMVHRVITSHKVQQEDTLGKVKATARASIIIMPILGFTWIFAILDFFFDELTFKYLFAIFNSLQGFFIFLFHCVFNTQVQQAWLKNTKKAERRSILDKKKTEEMRVTGSHESLDSIK